MSEISRVQFRGNSSIGVFAAANEKIAIVPPSVEKKALVKIKETLQVPIVETYISGISLIGTMVATGEDTLLVPPYTREDEVAPIKEVVPELHIISIPTKLTALGNVISISRKAVLVSRELEREARRVMSDELGLEVLEATVALSPLVGANILSTSRGCLVHPLVTEEELRFIRENFHSNVDITTVNRGVPYPHTGIIANSKGVVVGTDTTGPELMRIYDILVA